MRYLNELDFKQEVRNIALFRDIYRDRTDVVIPKPYSKFSNDKVIVMDYTPSVDMTFSAERLINMFLEQLLYEGVIHGDLHLGNIGQALNTDAIVLYDFGNVIRIPEFYQNAVRKLLVACQNRSSSELLNGMVLMGMKIKDEKAAKNFAKQFFVYLDTLDPKSFNYTSEDIMVPIELDIITLTIIRTYSLVEGLCKEIYPQFTYERVIQQNIELLTIEQLISRLYYTARIPL